MPNVPYIPVDPNTTTREAFTQNILDIQIPSDALQEWADAVRHQQGLYKALYDHEAMAPNRQQTFMTPAKQKSAVYFLWDFVGRTLQFLYMVDYKKAKRARMGQDKEIFEDALGRTKMSQLLAEDTTGKMDFMLHSNIDVRVEFNDAIKQAAAVNGPLGAFKDEIMGALGKS